MRITVIVICFCLFFEPLQLSAQTDKADSIFYQFEKCLSFYFKKGFKNIDSSYLFFYGNKLNISMDLNSSSTDGGRRFINDFKDALDSAHLNDTSHMAFFFRGMSFKEFANYLITQKAITGGECLIRNIKGVQIFVDCSDEVWDHFYFDSVLYKTDWILTPVVDIFKSDGKNIQHSRFILHCSFSPQKGFVVIKKFLLHRYKYICTQ